MQKELFLNYIQPRGRINPEKIIKREEKENNLVGGDYMNKFKKAQKGV